MLTPEKKEQLIDNILFVTGEKSKRSSILRFYGIVFLVFISGFAILSIPGMLFIALVVDTAKDHANELWAMQIHTITNAFWGTFAALLLMKFVSFMSNGILHGMIKNKIDEVGVLEVPNVYADVFTYALPLISIGTFVFILWYFITYLPVAL